MSQTRFIPEVANRQSFILLEGRRRVYGGLPLEESPLSRPLGRTKSTVDRQNHTISEAGAIARENSHHGNDFRVRLSLKGGVPDRDATEGMMRTSVAEAASWISCCPFRSACCCSCLESHV